MDDKRTETAVQGIGTRIQEEIHLRSGVGLPRLIMANSPQLKIIPPENGPRHTSGSDIRERPFPFSVVTLLLTAI